MSQTKDRVLVQGTVTFTVNCNTLKGLVEPEIAKDEKRLKEWLIDKAFKMIEGADENADIDFLRFVSVQSTTAEELTNDIIDNAEWKQCIEEDKANA